jgi:hypothetical protein
MSGDDLRVSVAHLDELAARHARAAADARAATEAVGGVDAAVRNTHGSIATPTSGALDAALAARRNAGANVADSSDTLCDKLADAAQRYGRTDTAAGSGLDAHMQAGRA